VKINNIVNKETPIIMLFHTCMLHVSEPVQIKPKLQVIPTYVII